MIRIKCSHYRTSAERGGFEPPKPVSQFNGLANRNTSAATPYSTSGLRHISEDLPTALPTDSCNIDADLAEVMDAWAKLPQSARDEVLAMVRTLTEDTT